MRDKFDVLVQHATDLRLEVRWALDLPDFIHGYYEHADAAIYLNFYCTHAQVLGAFGHEIGHGIAGDTCSSEYAERNADEIGASLLLTRDEYAAAETLVGSHAGELARHLGVTRDVVIAWRRWFRRVGHRLTKAA